MKLVVSFLVLLGAIAAHFYALYSGLYAAQLAQGVVWFDNVLHAFVGAAFTLTWFWILGRFAPKMTVLLQLVSALFFVAVMAIAWELFERGFYVFFTTHALGLRVYPQTLQESVFDSLSNIAGAAMVLLVAGKKLVYNTVKAIEE